jgi:hypothetical protein
MYDYMILNKLCLFHINSMGEEMSLVNSCTTNFIIR